LIKAARKEKKLTQEQLARGVGVSRSTVAMWETNQATPRAATLLKLADLFGCTVDELLREGGGVSGSAEEEAGVQVF